VGAVVLDSSVLLALLDVDDALRAAVVDVVTDHHAQGGQFQVPASVLAEVLVAESRRGRSEVDRRRQTIRHLFGPTRVVDDDIAVVAAALRAEHKSLRLPDALVISTGIVDDADAVLTADKRWTKVDKRIQVIG
jgi:predicted nucleic acid-binding protein